MKMKLGGFLMLIIAFIAFGCKKQGCMDEYALNYDVSAKKEDNKFCLYKLPEFEEYIPSYGVNTATLIAIDRGVELSYNKYGPSFEQWRFSLGAGFFENGKELVLAGNVSASVFSQEPVTPYNKYFMGLIKNSNNIYFKKHKNLVFAHPYNFPNPIKWKGTGDVWPSFNTSNSSGFSEASYVQSESPNLSSSYTFEVKPIASADSLVLQIMGQRKKIVKVISSNLSSHVFSQQEIESVGRGDAILCVVSVKYEKESVGGKTYYMLNQKRTSKEVFIN